MKSIKKLLFGEKIVFLLFPKNVLPRNYYSTMCNRVGIYHFKLQLDPLYMASTVKRLTFCNPLRNVKCDTEESDVVLGNDNFTDKSPVELLIFNSYRNFVEIKHNNKKHNVSLSKIKPQSVSLQYLGFEIKEQSSVSETKKVESVNFPYSVNVSVSDKLIDSEEHLPLRSGSSINKISDEKKECVVNSPSDSVSTNSRCASKWMNDYEKYTQETGDTEIGFDEWKVNYGTPQPSKPTSHVPCGGCGAFLHCQDPAIPGYLPSEIFLQSSNQELLSITCQRCHFMKYYNTALAVSVDRTLYPKLLSKIKDEKSLVLLLIDLTDFPCSIWPGILDIIGKKKPLFILGNKVDLLWGDSKSWLDHVTKLLKSFFPSGANIRHVALISAKTGFGIEELINKLHTIWQYKGDVFLVGCTNVGKSTLFNALLQSDYCKVKAVDLLQRATTSPWPGTTLNLLKFPILRPEGWRLHLRTLRLINERKKTSYEKMLKKELMKWDKTKETNPPQLIGHIGRTFQNKDNNIKSEENFALPNKKQIAAATMEGSGLNPNDPDFLKSKWFYDTPGVLHLNQILDLLTTEELMLTIPKKIIEPRTFIMKPKWTIFIAGLARLDYSEGSGPIRLTVFCSSNLPITICYAVDADQVYNGLLGSEYLRVPKGSEERMKQWPKLQKSNEISLMGINSSISCADVILSSAGWISVTPETKQICKFIPWVPLGRGVHVRIPSLLPNAVNFRGKKIRKSPAYGSSQPFI